jgi:metal-responsive CopG/Arc/MetJ family transcriptional regulator
MYMKAIQVTLDDELLAKLDADDEVRRDGRSAVIRRATAEYLRKRRKRVIAERYAAAYGGTGGLSSEFEGWEGEGTWPER